MATPMRHMALVPRAALLAPYGLFLTRGGGARGEEGADMDTIHIDRVAAQFTVHTGVTETSS
jgi:hypothetical protein